MSLDPRQRAMLREMGVRVWQPDAPTAPPEAAAPLLDAPETSAASAMNTGAEVGFDEKSSPGQRFTAPPAPRSTDAPVNPLPGASAPAVLPAASLAHGEQASWRMGEASALYGETARAGGARWLVLAETPAAALQAPPFDGPAGRLLDNMLRAARLHQAGAVLHAPLARLAAQAPAPEISVSVAALVRQFRPDMVLVMGRLASQALLATNEAFGRLRGRAHTLHGARAVLTFDATYLLRSPADKARAWDDLCLALSLLPAQPPPGA